MGNKYEKMLNIFSYQGNANQNYIEFPSQPSQNGYYPKKTKIVNADEDQGKGK
jgi:hypothetical protein